MTQAFQAATTIGRPVDQVWAQLTDWPHAAEWMPGVDGVRLDGATAVGTTLTVQARGKDRTSTITALEPGRSITLTSVQGGVTADYAYRCCPVAGGTEVTLVADVRTAGLWRLAGRSGRRSARPTAASSTRSSEPWRRAATGSDRDSMVPPASPGTHSWWSGRSHA